MSLNSFQQSRQVSQSPRNPGSDGGKWYKSDIPASDFPARQGPIAQSPLD